MGDQVKKDDGRKKDACETCNNYISSGGQGESRRGDVQRWEPSTSPGNGDRRFKVVKDFKHGGVKYRDVGTNID
jgi:hypothetical protein